MIQRGDIWLVELVDEEQASPGQPAGFRPAVVVSCDAFNRGRGTSVTVVPGTTSRRQVDYHVHVSPGKSGLTQPTEFMPEQIVTLSRVHLRNKVGRLQPDELHQLSVLLAEYLDLPGY